MFDMSKCEVGDTVISRQDYTGVIISIDRTLEEPYEILFKFDVGNDIKIHININGMRFNDGVSFYDVMRVEKVNLNKIIYIKDLKDGMHVYGTITANCTTHSFNDAMIRIEDTSIEGLSIYLLSNVADGRTCSNKGKYKYSWCITDSWNTASLLRDSYFLGELYSKPNDEAVIDIVNDKLAEINKLTSEIAELVKQVKK